MPRLLAFGPSWKQDEEVESAVSDRGGASHVPSTSGPSLLPRPVASLVSLFSQSTSLTIRAGTFIGGLFLDAGRSTTLTSLELSRAVVEGILTRAGRDVAVRSSGSQGKVEAESLLERSLAAVHTTITSTSFFTAASFHFTSTLLSSGSNMTQALLSTLDAILGSTESSRAIAAIITLIRQEIRDHTAEVGTEKVGVGDLLVGTVGFAMLSRWGRKNTERHMRMSGGVETIWDVVILDNGIRADVLEMHQIQPANSPPGLRRSHSRRSSFIAPGDTDDGFDVVERPDSAIDGAEPPPIVLPDSQHHIPDEDLRMYIMKQLPRGCRASMKTDSVTAQTITVNIYDDDDGGEITAPPGTMIVEDNYHDTPQSAIRETTGQQTPRHTIVFRTAFNKSQSADLRPPSRHLVGIREVNSDLDSQGSARSVIALDDSATSDADPEDTAENRDYGSKRQRIENGQPKPSSTAPDTSNASQAPPRETQPPGARRISESKSTFGRGSLSKFAQRVKTANGEKTENPRRSSLRLPFQQSNTQLSSGTSTPRTKVKAAGADRKPTAQTQTDKPTRQTKAGRPSPPPKLDTSSAANRVAPRTIAREHRVPASPSTSRYSGPRPSGSRADYYKVHEKSQESYMMQTDTYSPSPELRSGSPTVARAHVRSSSSLSLTRSESETTMNLHPNHRPTSAHRRSKSYTASLYSLATAGSDTSLVLAHRTRKSAYDDAATVEALNRDGLVPGIFPKRHFVRNIRRYCRYSSATYGSNALQVMGIPQAPKGRDPENIYSQEHNDFSHHTGLSASTILLSSYVDPAGGTNAAGETESGFPLVHYCFLDHESKAVVLALRGTWGFEDVLTDMTCAYDDLEWQGKNWKVHKGMHASAKHLLMGGGKRVMITIAAALEEFKDYGLVLCGHSLGGGVAGILATMISEPTAEVSSPVLFTTSSRPDKQFLSNGRTAEVPPSACYLPSGRPIHVYAFGPPATMSPFLRRATRGLITTVVNGQDVVPSLSLGILHDMHTTALAFKGDISEAKSHVRYRVWENLRQSIINKFYVNEAPMLLNAGDGLGEDAWAWRTLQSLRDSMLAPKLVPPGEVFVVETMRVLQRSAFTSDIGEDDSPRLGKPATRVQLKLIRDVEQRFGELRFGSGMFSDHNPARYEASLVALTRGIMDD
ncbi:hypothetical protein BDW69DRAFT_115008 [Aspergillus filifer]